ncbi:MAG: electron transfer flavoprotein-ubiquinone oxidoreductase [Burkholderiaceae bacterium]
MQRDAVDYDLVIVGGGPAGLAAAIRAKQLSQAMGTELSVCLVEKAAEIGGHILSGAVIDPRGLQELLPDWEKQGAPLNTPVTQDQFLFLSESGQTQVPSALLPSCFKNHGNYIASLSDLVKWLGQQAEALGVEIYPGFAAAELLYNAEGEVCGIATGNMGVGKDGKPTDQFQPGMELRARYTLFAEGSRGQLGRQLIERFNLDRYADPQSYGIGIKELWQVSPEQSKPGLVVHTAGWPLDHQTYGGSFLYHLNNQQVAIGLVVGLNYRNPWLSPFEEFQRLKSHPAIRKTLEGGKRIGYGARAITAGGLNSLPELIFPGGALIGCEAGFLNASRIKGSHAAIKTGMLAAEACVQALKQPDPPALISEYPKAFKASWLYEELYKARNFKPAMSKGLWLGTLLVGIDQTLFGGRAPWTLHNHKPDNAYLESADQHSPITYPKPDGVLRFDRLSSVFLSNTNHEENQPAHLTLKDNTVPVALNLTRYAGPEARYCPAGVYEYLNDQGQPVVTPGDGARLRINAQNCVHCKTCDIKDPSQNIVWVSPEGGGGPNYAGM